MSLFLSKTITLSTDCGGCNRRRPLRPHHPRRERSRPPVFRRDAVSYADCPAWSGEIPIPPALLDALKEHKAKELNNEYVFVKYEKHTRMDDNAFYQSWKNFVKEMDLANGAHLYRNQVKNSIIAPDFEPYLLRHTFCTDCQAAGVPINVAKEWMGHSDISVTAKIYTHMVDEVFEQNRARMAQYAVTKSRQVESTTATN